MRLQKSVPTYPKVDHTKNRLGVDHGSAAVQINIKRHFLDSRRKNRRFLNGRNIYDVTSHTLTLLHAYKAGPASVSGWDRSHIQYGNASIFSRHHSIRKIDFKSNPKIYES